MADTGYDEGGLFASDQNLNGTRSVRQHSVSKFREFIRSFRVGTKFEYRDQLRTNVGVGRQYLDVSLEDVNVFDEGLRQALVANPGEELALFEQAAREVVQQSIIKPEEQERAKPVQIRLTNSETMGHSIRSMTSSQISKLVGLSGIVIAASRVKAKATTVSMQCRSCGFVKTLSVRPGFGGVSLPRTCERVQDVLNGAEKCPMDPYIFLGEKCEYVDMQVLKLQELPEDVPKGEMPRAVQITVDRYLCNLASPGTRVFILGIYSIYQSAQRSKKGEATAVAIRNPYIRTVGLRLLTNGPGRVRQEFTPDEEMQFREFAKDPKVYEKLSASMASSIFGHEDIKKALACLLFGGSRTILPDGMRLRGDVNVLLLGDPSTAKSQLLKFIEKVAPIGVYTSGKGSSAAGLTAAVVKDPSSNEFYLEGGAMVLADGGVVCIDEFDKMREEDRVAIHEAMEQQTISIAKAGITTILNSRSSVLAAANPHFGRYDDLKSASENIDFQSTILSRFDLIFIVRDVRNQARDMSIANHVIALHMHGATEKQENELSIPWTKRFVSYCRMTCAPRLSPEAAEVLKGLYVKFRQQHGKTEVSKKRIPITVRQLEAVIRISESLAKMSLSPVATEEHVHEAYRLFKISTLEAASAGIDEESSDEVKACEDWLQSRLPMGHRTSYASIFNELTSIQRYDDGVASTAINNLKRRGILKGKNQGKILQRDVPS